MQKATKEGKAGRRGGGWFGCFLGSYLMVKEKQIKWGTMTKSYYKDICLRLRIYQS